MQTEALVWCTPFRAPTARPEVSNEPEPGRRHARRPHRDAAAPSASRLRDDPYSPPVVGRGCDDSGCAAHARTGNMRAPRLAAQLLIAALEVPIGRAERLCPLWLRG